MKTPVTTLMKWALLGIVLTMALAPNVAWARWRWELDNERYKRMNPFERAQYDKAANLVRQNNYKAAAGEFEKFKLQFGDSSNLSYILFMHGYCLHNATNRNSAIKVYHEVVDFFGDQTGDAGAAMYHIGIAHIQNGDTLKGLQVLKRMTEDPRFVDHPLTAGAIRQLADNHWNNAEFDEAVLAWKKVIRNFKGSSDDHVQHATNSLIACQVLRKKLPEVEQFLLEMSDEELRETPANRQRIAAQIWGQAYGTLWRYRHQAHTLPTAFGNKLTPEQGRALLDWFTTTRRWWEETDKQWEWHSSAAHALVYFVGDLPDKQKRLEEAVQVARSPQDPNEADDRLARLANLCRDGNAYDLSDYCIQRMHNRHRAQFEAYENLVRRNQLEEALQSLLDLEAAGDAEWAQRAKQARAELYRHRLNRQEEAIKLYTELNNPPHTLWAIQDSYMRMGRLEDSLRTLQEIQNMFPDQAARALWQQAENCHRGGNRKQAATYARAILSRFKDSPESSRAHQLLEDYGIKTGGGVIHE